MSFDDIRARAEAATEGPWKTERYDLRLLVVSEKDALTPIDMGYIGNRPEPDAEFIAHARTDIPKLLAALDAVEEICVIAETEHGGARRVTPNYIHPDAIRAMIAQALQ